MLWTFFERLRIVITAVIFIILITAFLVFPAQVADFANAIHDQEGYIRILLVLGALLADAFLIYLIYREFSNARRYVKGKIIRSADANVQISLESVEENLNTAISKLEQIYEVKTDANTDRQGRLQLKLDVTASDRVSVTDKTKEIVREIERVVEKRMGLKTGTKPEIKFHLLDQSPAAATVPSTPTVRTETPQAETKPSSTIVQPPALIPDAETFEVNSAAASPEVIDEDKPEVNNL